MKDVWCEQVTPENVLFTLENHILIFHFIKTSNFLKKKKILVQLAFDLVDPKCRIGNFQKSTKKKKKTAPLCVDRKEHCLMSNKKFLKIIKNEQIENSTPGLF